MTLIVMGVTIQLFQTKKKDLGIDPNLEVTERRGGKGGHYFALNQKPEAKS